MSPELRPQMPSTGLRLHVWMRTACLTVAMSLLALPVSVLAEEAEAADLVSDILIAPVADPAYVWNRRLAADYSAPVTVPVAGSIAAPVADPAYVWNRRLAADYSAPVTVPVAGSIAAPAYVWDPAGRAAMVRDHFLLEHASQSQG
jgi:hypothetical protein